MTHDDVSIRPDRTPLVPPGGIEPLVRDMTVIASADVTLATLQSELAKHDQWLPIDGDPNQTLGRLVETNSTGPLRLGYGAWRDLLLGVQFHNGRGELITAGGRTVKNVAGYDLTKFMVGQHGVFGKIITIATRTYRRPEGALLARFDASDCTINDLLPTPARPQWALLTPTELLCGYLGDARTIDYYEQILPQEHPIGLTRRSLDEDIEHRRELWSSFRPNYFRAAVPPNQIIVLRRDRAPAFVDALTGRPVAPQAAHSAARA